MIFISNCATINQTKIQSTQFLEDPFINKGFALIYNENLLKEKIISRKIEEDMRLRGFGDLLGFKQSGAKNFRLADPIQNEDLFILAEKQIKKIEQENINIEKYRPLLKLYDQADIINDIV
jgi:hypothetical protein